MKVHAFAPDEKALCVYLWRRKPGAHSEKQPCTPAFERVTCAECLRLLEQPKYRQWLDRARRAAEVAPTLGIAKEKKGHE